jgi:hypothetical protein
MRKVIVAVTALATALSAAFPVPGSAQAVSARSTPAAATIDPVVVATIKAFPSGGQALVDRIRMLVLQNNDLAADVARCLTSREVLSAPQREAVEKGLAEALSRLGVYAQVDGFDPGWAFLAAMLAAGGIAGYAASKGHSNSNNPLPIVSLH